MSADWTPRVTPAVLASRKRACELGASFIEADLARLRHDVIRGEEGEGQAIPATTSHEGDLLKAMEWASAVTWLRAMAAQEGDPR